MTVPARPPPHFPPRRGSGLFASFGHAWAGLIHTVVHQRNMRVHLTSAMLVGLVGSGIALGLAEKVTLIFCVLLIFFAEILNSALEHLVDLAVQQFDEKARLTKDAAAAGVLVLALGTVVIFAAILVHNWETVRTSTDAIIRQVAFGIPLTACVLVLVLPQRRPLWVDLLAFLGGGVLLGILATRSASMVFSAMTAGLLFVAGSAAYTRRREARSTGQPPGDSPISGHKKTG
ncbi:diacylglycerol kinase family protein [Myxococcus sp. CA051A]|uniref:diacylglycerol kinase family protein n=1 Tax=unclassified Myxococcus TaxID=2648731 RepID=UPI00157B119B|nr:MULTISPECIES: diacylglycerol kinase family protein [unclassified Myxococcus]NTX13523.1 diacylglycerol kinase family protein [Myxococcus sp. CA056]NTX35616.1 diacylglycerol kinase family protein [Myxococcus sp. CA033]NTX50811.1 diacylglycerol kinase family protein [Myxococcus sp. CA039A]NTX61980.1 diacylglycerol kinase family protein [Myxococcus sp. CA051A]